jgi:hypothetical protein
MLEVFLAIYPWLAILLWILSFASDYYLTLYGARLHNAHVQEHISYGGSYELTPAYQQAVDSQQRISMRMAAVVSLIALLTALVWFLSVRLLGLTWPFALLMGGLLLREVAIHLRHFRNIVVYRDARRPGALTGKIEYARWLVFHQSAVDLWGFAGLFLLAALLTGSIFIAGGALACGLSGWQHYRFSRKALPLPTDKS